MAVDYDTFGDTPVTLTLAVGGANVANIPFNTPGRDPNEAASLEFQLHPAGLSTISVEINGFPTIPTVSVNSFQPKAMRENFLGGTLNNGANVLTATLTSGDDIRLSDFKVDFKV